MTDKKPRIKYLKRILRTPTVMPSIYTCLFAIVCYISMTLMSNVQSPYAYYLLLTVLNALSDMVHSQIVEQDINRSARTADTAIELLITLALTTMMTLLLMCVVYPAGMRDYIKFMLQ